jgi:hypothetical protein
MGSPYEQGLARQDTVGTRINDTKFGPQRPIWQARFADLPSLADSDVVSMTF